MTLHHTHTSDCLQTICTTTRLLTRTHAQNISRFWYGGSVSLTSFGILEGCFLRPALSEAYGGTKMLEDTGAVSENGLSSSLKLNPWCWPTKLFSAVLLMLHTWRKANEEAKGREERTSIIWTTGKHLAQKHHQKSQPPLLRLIIIIINLNAYALWIGHKLHPFHSEGIYTKTTSTKISKKRPGQGERKKKRRVGGRGHTWKLMLHSGHLLTASFLQHF